MAQSNGLSTNNASRPKEGVTSPYMSNDPNSNVANFKIIESTLRGKSID
jgi:homocitrate synthase